MRCWPDFLPDPHDRPGCASVYAAARIPVGRSDLHRLLARLDPVSAGRIHVNDVPKTMRAIEVSLAVRQPMSEVWKSGRDPLTGYRLLRIGLNPERAALYRRIDARARDV